MWGGGNNNNNNDGMNNNNSHHGYNHHATAVFWYSTYGATVYDDGPGVNASAAPQEPQFYPQFSNAGVGHGNATQNDLLQQMMVAAAVQQ